MSDKKISTENSKQLDREGEQFDLNFKEINSSLAHYNFPPGSINHPHIMEANTKDIPRIRTWTEFRRWSEHEDLSAPCLFYQANGEINQLVELTFDEETVLLCNAKGLHIFLFEPLCLYYQFNIRWC